MSVFERLELLSADPILGIPLLFAADPRSEKVNLGVGTYRDERGKPQVLSAVIKAEHTLAEQKMDKEYLPIDGATRFNELTRQLIFGTLDRSIATVQTIGASGALYLGGALLAKIMRRSSIYLPTPTWSNHAALFQRGGLKTKDYPYFNPQRKNFYERKFFSALHKMKPESIVLLHVCCHNPTGIDPSFEQWKEISRIMKEKKLIPFFDFAYQGFGESIEEDAQPVRFFAELGHEMLVANSYSKNFGLYGERVGSLSVVCESQEAMKKVLSQLKKIIRSCYSSPPKHGSQIIETILHSPALKKEWEEELSSMRLRISHMRQEFTQLLESVSGQNFRFLAEQKGFFSYLCLTQEQVLRLRQEYGIYMQDNSRINIGGLTKDNIRNVAQSIAKVL